MIRKILAVFISLLINFNTIVAQEIQWASDSPFQFNAYGTEDFSGKSALGPPDALPSGDLHQKAFRLKNEKDFGTLIVSFSKPQKASQIIVVENNIPGRIIEIALHDAYGQKNVIYKNEAQIIRENHRALIVTLAETPYLVEKVEINVNTTQKEGWAQIDAVGIANNTSLLKIEGELYGFAQANIQTEIAFASKKENLGPNINSDYIEAKPLIAADGRTLYFTRQNHPENTKGKKDEGDIYVSTWHNEGWSPAKNLGKPLNDDYANAVTSVSPDGNTLLLINHYSNSGVSENGASISKKTKNGWSFPEKVSIQDHHNKSNFADYYLANNGKVLLMAIETTNSLGDQDLYVSFQKKDQTWSPPLNLGEVINTDKAEFSPFLASDNKTLYFSSEGHPGLGGSDIFYTKRMDESWQKWSTPKNLGNAINTAQWDAYYATDAAGNYAYFVSNSGSSKDIEHGSKDIYRIALNPEFKPEPVVLISGKVYNEKTKEPISAEIIFEILPSGNEEGIATSDPTEGSYKIVLTQGNNYGFMAKAKGYIAINENLDLTSITTYEEIERDLYLVPIEVGAIIKLNNIFFEQSKAVLLENSSPEIERLATILKENPVVEIELGGHTDNQGIPKLNLELSKDRVEMVKSFLVNEGISPKRIVTKAYGGSKPVASNASEETRALNRRVEVKILKK